MLLVEHWTSKAGPIRAGQHRSGFYSRAETQPLVLSVAGGFAMATINRTNLVKNLCNDVVVKQDRVATAGNRDTMREPSAALSFAWRLVPPGSGYQPTPKPRPVVGLSATPATASRTSRLTVSRSGSLAILGEADSHPFSGLHQSDRHDCQSHVCREAGPNGSRETAFAETSGK